MDYRSKDWEDLEEPTFTKWDKINLVILIVLILILF